MTTTVVIKAHCASTKHVEAVRAKSSGSNDPDEVLERFTLEDGETAERVVYDSIYIAVREVEKPS